MRETSRLARADEAWASAGLILILAAELGGALFFESEVVRAVLVTVVLAGVAILGSLRALVLRGLRVRREPIVALAWIAPILVAGGYGAAVAVTRENSAYYILADAYHVFGELAATTVVVAALLARLDGAACRRAILSAALAGALITSAATVMGSLGLLASGGHLVESLGIWRVWAGRGFPLVPLILVTAMIPARRGLGPGGRWTLALCWLLLFGILAMSLKRASWLTWIALLPVLLWRPAPLRFAMAAGALTLPVVVLGIAIEPTLLIDVAEAANAVLTYNPNYTIFETLRERYDQIGMVAGYLLATPWGYGMGAEFLTWWPSENTYGTVHYIHNLYVYLLLQLGYLGGLLLLAPMLVVCVELWRRVGRAGDWEWAARGSLASIVGLMVTGLTMVSLHTVIAGLAFGLAIRVTIAVGAGDRR